MIIICPTKQQKLSIFVRLESKNFFCIFDFKMYKQFFLEIFKFERDYLRIALSLYNKLYLLWTRSILVYRLKSIVKLLFNVFVQAGRWYWHPHFESLLIISPNWSYTVRVRYINCKMTLTAFDTVNLKKIHNINL